MTGVVRDLCWYAEWSKESPHRFILIGLNQDFHPDNHYVELVREGQGRPWKVIVSADMLGETDYSKDLGVMKPSEAKDEAIGHVVDCICEKGASLKYDPPTT